MTPAALGLDAHREWHEVVVTMEDHAGKRVELAAFAADANDDEPCEVWAVQIGGAWVTDLHSWFHDTTIKCWDSEARVQIDAAISADHDAYFSGLAQDIREYRAGLPV